MLIYQEKISFKQFLPLMILFSGITIFFFYIFFLQLIGAEVSDTHGPIGFSIFMAIFFAITTIVIAQFKELSVNVTDQQLIVNYGIFKRVINRNIMEHPYIDQANSLWSYGGWGIRLGRYKGKKRFVYNLPNTSRVVVPLKGKSHEFVFSTEQPDKVIAALKA